jgi:general secretion pathway protein D
MNVQSQQLTQLRTQIRNTPHLNEADAMNMIRPVVIFLCGGWGRTWSAALFTLLLTACAGQDAYRDARALLANDQAGAALSKLEEAARLDPHSAQYRLEYLKTRQRLTNELLLQAERAKNARQFDVAEAAYRRALELQPDSESALYGLKQIERERRWDDWLTQAQTYLDKKDFDAARPRIQAVLLENPGHAAAAALMQVLDKAGDKASAPPAPVTALSANYKKTVSLEFRDASIKTIFELIAKSAGLNFVFDKDVRTDQKTSIFLRNSTVEAAVSRLLITNQLDQRVLDENTVLIYPDTPAKQKDYQLLTVKSFYLSNADAKNVANTLKTLLKVKDVVVDERQNMLTLRDTPEVVRLAEKLVVLNDVPEAEVMLEVEVIEVKRTGLLDLGIRWPDQASFTPLSSASGTQLTLNDLKNLSGNTMGVAVNPLSISGRKTQGTTNILANPRIRSKNREKAKILIGDRVPNITTTSTATGFISDSVNYIDVGLKLDVEPTIYPDNEIVIKVGLEVSNIVSQVETKSGTRAYQIGTRNANTVLRLKDGENQILAGLINDEDRKTASRIPGLGDIPVAGRLFGGQADETSKTEIVLSITPRLIRGLVRPGAAVMEFESGTESGLRSRSGEGGGSVSTNTTLTNTPAGTAPWARPAGSPLPPGAPGSGLPLGSNQIGLGTNINNAPNNAGLPLPLPLPLRDAEFRLLGPLQVRNAQTFTVDLWIDPKKPVVALPLALGFDPAVVQVLSVEEGDFMRQGGAASQLESRIDQGGQVLLTLTRKGAAGATSSGKVATLTLRAVAANKTSVIQVLTVAPQGEGGASLTTGLPAALQFAVTP